METRGQKRKRLATSSEDTSQEKVVKRPARGYHTYRNGLMNVTPKSPEHVQAARANSKNCPLLRLPGELRNKIWREVFAGYTVNIRLRLSYRGSLQTYPHKWSLLRTCRQIYSETALLPYTMSVFSGVWYDVYWNLRYGLRKIKAAFRQHIKAIELYRDDYSKQQLQELQQLLPGLSYVIFSITCNSWNSAFGNSGKYKRVYCVNDTRASKDALARLFPQVGVEVEHVSWYPDLSIGISTWFWKRNE